MPRTKASSNAAGPRRRITKHGYLKHKAQRCEFTNLSTERAGVGQALKGNRLDVATVPMKRRQSS